jgi:hypothetical protein
MPYRSQIEFNQNAATSKGATGYAERDNVAAGGLMSALSWRCPGLQDLVAGQIDMALLDPTTTLAQVRAGRVKASAFGRRPWCPLIGPRWPASETHHRSGKMPRKG